MPSQISAHSYGFVKIFRLEQLALYSVSKHQVSLWRINSEPKDHSRLQPALPTRRPKLARSNHLYNNMWVSTALLLERTQERTKNRTAGDSGAELRSLTSTPEQPRKCAERRMAPKFCAISPVRASSIIVYWLMNRLSTAYLWVLELIQRQDHGRTLRISECW